MRLRTPILDASGNPIPGMFNMQDVPQAETKQPLSACVHFGGKLDAPRVPCVSCRGTMLDTFGCAIHQRCTPMKPADGIACCATCPDIQRVHLMRWAYGVTTVPKRRHDLLPQTLASLKEAGFDKPRLFVDGDNNPEGWERQFGLEVVVRYPTIGAYGNWILALAELYIREYAADRYAIFQDDFVTYRNLRSYLERCPYPEKGYLNLYTMPSNQRDTPGWYEGALLNSGPEGFQTGRGAVGLVFSRDAVNALLMEQGEAVKHIVQKPLDAAKRTHKIDGCVVTAMNKAGWREFVHNPSLVQHTGKVSAIGNLPHKLALSFRGAEFDAMQLLAGS